MRKEIIYSFKEYEEEYHLLLDEYFAEYAESEEVDFINSEIENYNSCLQIVKLPIDKVFNRWFRIEIGSDLKTVSTSHELYNFIFENENEKYYYKIYSDITASPGEIEKKVKQARLSFAKIIEFLKNKKSELETNSQTIMNAKNTLNWQGSELEFAELVKALIASKKLNPELTQTKIFERMKQFFNVDDFSESDKLKEIRNRTNTPTPLINILGIALTNWIDNKVPQK